MVTLLHGVLAVHSQREGCLQMLGAANTPYRLRGV